MVVSLQNIQMEAKVGNSSDDKDHGISAVHKVTNPHDKFFKEVFSQKKTAVNFLAHHLPSDVLEALNLETIEIRKDSFIDEELRESFSDLLYEVKLADHPRLHLCPIRAQEFFGSVHRFSASQVHDSDLGTASSPVYETRPARYSAIGPLSGPRGLGRRASVRGPSGFAPRSAVPVCAEFSVHRL